MDAVEQVWQHGFHQIMSKRLKTKAPEPEYLNSSENSVSEQSGCKMCMVWSQHFGIT